MGIKAGVSKLCISPAVGSELAGYAARKGRAIGIHDDLYVRSLVVESGAQAAALVSVEVLALAEDFVQSCREAIERRVGIPARHILIAATHTHAGPVTIKSFFNQDQDLDRAYLAILAERIEQSVAEAWVRRFPARMGIASGHVTGIGVNRRTPDRKPVDEEVGIVFVEDESRAACAVVVNYGCHPTVLGPDNLLVTADFPGVALETIERHLGAGSVALFFNGAQGDISVGHSSDLSAIGVIAPDRTFEKADEFGQRLAQAVIESLPYGQTHADAAVAIQSAKVSCPVKPYPPPSETMAALEAAQREVEERERQLAESGASLSLDRALVQAKMARLYAQITDYYARLVADGSHPITRKEVELQAVRLGPAAFLAIPAEIFVEIGLEIKRRSPLKTFIVGLANGYIGYLPTEQAYETGGYECVAALLAPRADKILVEASLEVLHLLATIPE